MASLGVESEGASGTWVSSSGHEFRPRRVVNKKLGDWVMCQTAFEGFWAQKVDGGEQVCLRGMLRTNDVRMHVFSSRPASTGLRNCGMSCSVQGNLTCLIDCSPMGEGNKSPWLDRAAGCFLNGLDAPKSWHVCAPLPEGVGSTNPSELRWAIRSIRESRTRQ